MDADPNGTRVADRPRGQATYTFICTCGWEGPDAVMDAHMNPWCPTCGRPADFKLP